MSHDGIHGTETEKRAILADMGEAKVRRSLDQGVLVWQLHALALQWLDELETKKDIPDAAPEGQVASDDLGQHSGDGEVGTSG